jgi:O-methyltransferase
MNVSPPPPSVVSRAAIYHLLGLAVDTPPGCFVEVGVYRGGTAWHLARLARETGRAIHLFDTFSGMPEAGPEDLQHKIGDFADCSEAAVRSAIPDAVFHVGMFPHTMPKDMSPIAFAHIDCDQYASIKACIRHLWPLIVPNGIMLFDDYSHTSGAKLAIDQEFRDWAQPTPQGMRYVRKIASEERLRA